MLRLSDDQIQAALYAISDLVARRRLEGRPLPREVAALHRTLLVASEAGSETGPDAGELDHDFVDTAEAATIIGCSPRWVREIRADLEGRRYGCQWLFPRAAVVAYAEARHTA